MKYNFNDVKILRIHDFNLIRAVFEWPHNWHINRTEFHTQIDLITHRGGCIICMDYSAYSGDYGYLLGHFKEIAKILTAKLIALRDNFFSARTAYLFGFSFGARLIAQSGNDFGPQQIGTIHCK